MIVQICDMNHNPLHEEDVVWFINKLHMIAALDDDGFVFIDAIDGDGWLCPVDWVHCSQVRKLTEEEHEQWFCPPSKQGQTGLPAVVPSVICLDDTPEIKEKVRAAFEQAAQVFQERLGHKMWGGPVVASRSYEITPPSVEWKPVTKEEVFLSSRSNEIFMPPCEHSKPLTKRDFDKPSIDYFDIYMRPDDDHDR